MPRSDANRDPVTTYEEALSWLFKYSNSEEWLFDPSGRLPLEAMLVCDMFWVSQTDLLHDMRKIWNKAAGPMPRVAPLRRSRSAGWR